MSTVWWDRAQAVGVVDPLAVDALDGHVLVLDGVTAHDDAHLGWCRYAPCVVMGTVPRDHRAPAAVDVAVGESEGDVLDELVGRIGQRPQACRTLVDVLRATSGVDVPTGLVVESLAYSMLLAGDEFTSWLVGRPASRSRTFAGPPVVLARRGPRLDLALARPENRNAFSAAMRDALFEAVVLAEVDETIEEVLVTGEGPVFSSGGDLGEFGTAADVVRAHEVRTQRSVGAVLARIASKVTVRVHGSCVGAGVELPAFAGRVVAAPDATFRLPEIGMGLIPGAGGTVSISRRIGRQRTARLAILEEVIGAPEASAIGLVDAIG